jgi:hypothetical protein
MVVYHGSDTQIEVIDLDKCKSGRDFGHGFYVTKLQEQARTMAKRVSRWSKKEPVVTEFEFDEMALIDKDLKVLQFADYNEEWLEFVALNRKNNTKQQAHNYDIVEGPVADDRITVRIDEYMDGIISKEQFLRDLVYNPSHQMCFCTVQSLQALSLSKGRIDSAGYHIDSDVLQALMTDYGIPEIEAADIYYTSETYSKLADETTGLYKELWTKIYEMLKEELKQ